MRGNRILASLEQQEIIDFARHNFPAHPKSGTVELKFLVIHQVRPNAVRHPHDTVENRSSAKQALGRVAIDAGIGWLQKSENFEKAAIGRFGALQLHPISALRAQG